MALWSGLLGKNGGDGPTTGPFRVAGDERIYAVGDIHGRHDLLNRLLEVIARDMMSCGDERKNKLVFLGDYVDRGDHSREVLDILFSISADYEPDQVTFLRGNHEDALLAFLDDPHANLAWLRFGGMQTFASYGIQPPNPSSDAAAVARARDLLAEAMGDHVAFIERTEPMLRSGDVVFVHAGLDPDAPLNGQSSQAMFWGSEEFVERGGFAGLRVVHGHYDDDNPVVTPTRVCLDTGAYYSGRLTAIRLDEGEKLLGT